MRYESPQYGRIILNREEYEILDNARKLLTDMRQKLLDKGALDTEKFVVYDECTDIDSSTVTLSELTQAEQFIYNIV